MKYLFLIALLLCSGSIRAEPVAEPLQLAELAVYKPNTEEKVVMYATSWCGYCQQARNYFHQQGIPFTEYDTERDAEAKRRFRALRGGGVPLIFVGKRRMAGWSASGFNKIYQ